MNIELLIHFLHLAHGRNERSTDVRVTSVTSRLMPWILMRVFYHIKLRNTARYRTFFLEFILPSFTFPISMYIGFTIDRSQSM